jgi:phage gp29-like protein
MSLLVRIAGALGIEQKRARLAAGDRSTVVPDLALWNQATRIGGGLTPTRVSNIIRQADSGDMRSLQDLAHECRQRDPHLQAVLATSEESIAGLPWQIVPPENARTKDRRAAEWCQAALLNNPGVQRLIGSLAGAIYHSYAVNEILWEKVDGRMVPGRFAPISHRRFGFRLHDGAFVWKDDGMGQDGVDFRAEHPFKFIVSQPRVTGDIPNREGLCRTLIWMSVFRNWVISDWLRTAETSWKPWRIGKYKKGATATEDREGLEDVMRRLTTEGAAVIPDSSDVKIEWPAGAGGARSTHGEFVNVLAQEMSKAVLGQTETTQASTSSGYAQAKVHDAVRKDLREARARQIAADITRDLIWPMVALNFDGVVPGRFTFVTQDSVNLKEFSEAISTLTSAGLIIPQKWVRDIAGIPEPKDDEPTIGGTDEIPVTVEEPVSEPTGDANGQATAEQATEDAA